MADEGTKSKTTARGEKILLRYRLSRAEVMEFERAGIHVAERRLGRELELNQKRAEELTADGRDIQLPRRNKQGEPRVDTGNCFMEFNSDTSDDFSKSRATRSQELVDDLEQAEYVFVEAHVLQTQNERRSGRGTLVITMKKGVALGDVPRAAINLILRLMVKFFHSCYLWENKKNGTVTVNFQGACGSKDTVTDIRPLRFYADEDGAHWSTPPAPEAPAASI
jgi:hypothetical protein